jgi:hypothetical protein
MEYMNNIQRSVVPRSEKVYWGGGIGIENLDVHYGSSPSIASQPGEPELLLLPTVADPQTVPMTCVRVCKIFVPARISLLRRGHLLASIGKRFVPTTGFPALL